MRDVMVSKFKKSVMASILVSVISLTGCQTNSTNAYTGESETNNVVKNGAMGCLAGALVGAIANKGKGAAIGCVAAGGVGMAIGHSMDKQEAALRQELINTGVQIERNEDNIKLLIQGDISFDTGKTVLSSSIKPALNSVVKIMNNFNDTELIITGHTDSVGSSVSNQALSEARAKVVQAYLNQRGLSRSRTYSEGYGELSPICSNETKQGRECNRRVELTLIGKKG